MTPKHERLLQLAAGPRGVSADLYVKEAIELRKLGKLVLRTVNTTGGNQAWRHFLAEAA